MTFKPIVLALPFAVLAVAQTGIPFVQSSTVQANQPNYIFAADVNRDGKVDILFNSQETLDGPVVFLGNGAGSLKFLGNGPLILSTPYMAVGDLDGDGIPDIVTAQGANSLQTGRVPGGITVLHGRGDGTFAQAYQFHFPLDQPVTPGEIIIADVNHDGVMDIIFSDFLNSVVRIFYGAGGGSFLAPVAFATPSCPGTLITGDFDGDGNIDLAVALSCAAGGITPASSALTFLFGDGAGRFNQSVTIQLPGLQPATLAAADFDGDGATDLAVGGLSAVPPQMIWGSKTRQFSAAAIPGSPAGFCVTAADFDGDGFPDLAVTCASADVFINRGGRNWQKVYSFSSSLGVWTSLAADMNGDGKPDLVSIASNNTAIDVFLNQISPWTAQLSASNTSVAYGAAVTLDANFFPGKNPVQPPSGTVTWIANNAALGASQVNPSGSAYAATFVFAPAPGVYNITMKCIGAAAANSVVLNVAKAQSSVAGALVSPTATAGSAIQFSAIVSGAPPATAVPAGTIVVTEGGTQLASLPLDSSGHAQGAIHESLTGVHTIQLNYSGDALYASSSTTLTFLVAGSLVVVSAADGLSPVAPGSIVSLYGTNLSTTTTTAASLPLSTTLGGVQVSFTDSTGASFPAPIYLASPGQVNAVVPQVATGAALVQVTSYGLTQAAGAASVVAAAPALFSANASGSGVAAATLLTIDATGTASSQLVFTCGTAPGSCVDTPLDLSDASKQYYLVLYGTGLGGSAATATLGGAPAPVLYSGPQGQYPGLDQINIQLPGGVSGVGSLIVKIAVGAQTSNGVSIIVR